VRRSGTGRLNSRAYFYVRREGADRLVAAYPGHEQVTITVDPERLLNGHQDRVALSTINTGYALRRPVQRGSQTFISLSDFPAKRAGDIAEVTVRHGIEDIAQLVTAVDLDAKRKSQQSLA